MGDTLQSTPARPRRTLRGRIARGLLRCCQFFLLLLALYLLVALVGLIPVNNNFEPTADGVEIMVTSTEIHADLILPIRNKIVDWSKHLPPSDFSGDISGATHVAFGWGNKEFYVDTPTWADVKAGTVFRALFWPSATCMHVNLWDDNAIPSGTRKTTISHEQYRHLVEYVLGSFRRDTGGRFLLIEGGAYGTNDAFYHAHGSYHAFNTCNCWVGRGMKVAGVRTGWFTPLPKTVSLYLPAAQAPDRYSGSRLSDLPTVVQFSEVRFFPGFYRWVVSLGHSVKLCCPSCGETDCYRYPHRLWITAYVRSSAEGHKARVLASSPLRVVRCRSCGIAYSCTPAGGRHRLHFLLPVDEEKA